MGNSDFHLGFAANLATGVAQVPSPGLPLGQLWDFGTANGSAESVGIWPGAQVQRELKPSSL